MALCEGFSYHKCEILWLPFSIAQTSTKNKNDVWNKIYWYIISSSKQHRNIIHCKKNYLRENLWLNRGEKQKIPSY